MRYSDTLNQHVPFRARGNSAAMSKDDASLLHSLRTNPTQEAFAQLCDNHAKAAFNMAKHITRDQHLAEEAVQETMLTLWKWHDKLETGDLHSWIMRAVINKSMNLLRGRSRREKAARRFREANVGAPSALKDNSEHSEVLSQLKHHVSELSLEDRELVALRFVANLSQTEIAEHLKVPQTTVSARIRRVLQFLRGKLTSSGLAASLPTLNAADIRHAITAGDSMSPEFLTRLKNTPAQANATDLISYPRKAWVSALAILVFATAGLAWHQAGLTENPVAESSPTDQSQSEANPAAKLPTPSSSVSESDFEKLYEDEFDGTSMHPFWAKVPSSEYLHFNHKNGKSRLVLSIDNTKAPKDAKPIEVELESAPIDLFGERSLFIRFNVLAPDLSGTVEYGNQILNPDGSHVYNLGARVTYISKEDGYMVMYLQSSGTQGWEKPRTMKRPPSSLLHLNLTTLEPSKATPRFPPPGVVGRQFKSIYTDDFSVQTQSTQHRVKRVRIRFFIKVYPGSRIKWRMDSALVYRSTRLLPPDTKSPIPSEYYP